jgi:hypothetical protein
MSQSRKRKNRKTTERTAAHVKKEEATRQSSKAGRGGTEHVRHRYAVVSPGSRRGEREVGRKQTKYGEKLKCSWGAFTELGNLLVLALSSFAILLLLAPRFHELCIVLQEGRVLGEHGESRKGEEDCRRRCVRDRVLATPGAQNARSRSRFLLHDFALGGANKVVGAPREVTVVLCICVGK